MHTLTARFNSLPLPEVEMVDMREEFQSGNMSFLSQSLKEQLAAIEDEARDAYAISALTVSRCLILVPPVGISI